MMTPVKGNMSMPGSVVSTTRTPRSISECVFCRMDQVTAAEFMPLPSMEITLAAKMKRSGRWRRMVRTAFTVEQEWECANLRGRAGGENYSPGKAGKGPIMGESRLPRPGGGKLRVSATRVLRVAALVGCAAALWAGTPGAEPPNPVATAYLRNQLVTFNLAPLEKGQQPFSVGPWSFGARVSDLKPRDKRLNLYLVAPGALHRADGFEEFDHNDVINALPPEGAVVEWDVYWVIVLDPALKEELRSEQELIVEAQKGFVPGDLFEFQDVPGQAFLRTFLSLDSLDDLASYRLQNGQLPRVIIVPAGFAVRAIAAEPTGHEAETPAAARK